MTQREAIARRFSDILFRDLGRTKVEKAAAANRAEHNKNICHSHDYCDANMAMLEAANEVLMLEVDLEDEETMILIDQAWSIAKANEFYIK